LDGHLHRRRSRERGVVHRVIERFLVADSARHVRSVLCLVQSASERADFALEAAADSRADSDVVASSPPCDPHEGHVRARPMTNEISDTS
jgi:hypothetical protein